MQHFILSTLISPKKSMHLAIFRARPGMRAT